MEGELQNARLIISFLFTLKLRTVTFMDLEKMSSFWRVHLKWHYKNVDTNIKDCITY